MKGINWSKSGEFGLVVIFIVGLFDACSLALLSHRQMIQRRNILLHTIYWLKIIVISVETPCGSIRISPQSLTKLMMMGRVMTMKRRRSWSYSVIRSSFVVLCLKVSTIIRERMLQHGMEGLQQGKCSPTVMQPRVLQKILMLRSIVYTWWQKLSSYMQELLEERSATNIQERRKAKPNASEHREEEEERPKEVGIQKSRGVK